MRDRDNYLPEIEQLAEDQVRACRPPHGRAHPPRGERDGRAPRLPAHLRERPARLDPLDHRPGERPHLPAARLDPRRPRPAVDGAAGDGAPPARPHAPGELRRVPPAAARDQLLRGRLPDAAGRSPSPSSQQAKKEKRLAIEDFRDAFGVTHEAAALRFTNLATSHLDMTLHFLRVGGDGALLKGYENDGLRLPTDVTGLDRGPVGLQEVERAHGVRAHQPHDRVLPVHRHAGGHVLVRHADRAHGCRGVLDHRRRAVRAGEVVPRARDDAAGVVDAAPTRAAAAARPTDSPSAGPAQAWPSARLHAHVLSPLPSGTFPGVDDAEVYEFLEAHADQ